MAVPRNPLALLTRRQLQALIDAYVSNAAKPVRADFASQRRRTVEVAKALAELQRGIGPATNAAYQGAAATQGGLAQGFTGQLRDVAQADADAAAAELARIGAPDAQIQQVRGVGVGAPDAAYAVGGYIPGQALSREGAAFAAAQNQLPATTLGRGQYDIMGINQKEREFDLTLPKLRADYQNQLIGQEVTKAELGLRQQAQSLYESQFVEKVRHNVAGERTARRRASIAQQNADTAAKRHQLAVSKAAADGRKVNATASAANGYLSDQNGRPILDKNGRKIPVKKGGGLTPAQQAENRRDAISEARALYGSPLEAKSLDPNAKRYEARDGATGADVYVSPVDHTKTTTNPKKAKRDKEMSFGQAVNYIAETYQVSRTKARRWLIAAGWPPPRKRGKVNQKTNPKPGSPGADRPG